MAQDGEMAMKNRVDFILSNSHGKMLDVGCSACTLHGQIKRKFPAEGIYGLDIEVRKEDAHYKKGSAEKMPFASGEFDTVIGGELVEHLKKPEAFISEAARVLKPNGVLLLTTPNRNSWVNKIFKTYNTPIHVSLMAKKELARLLSSKGFRVEEFFCLPYTEESSEGARHAWAFALRKAVHFLLPQSLQEEMCVKARKV